MFAAALVATVLAGCLTPVPPADAGHDGGALDVGSARDASHIDDVGGDPDVRVAPPDAELDAATVPTDGGGSCVPPGSALFGLWRFDGDPGDSSAGAHDLETFGIVAYDPTGRYGQALPFPGDPSHTARRSVDDTGLGFGAADFSIALWVRFGDLSGGQVLLEDWSGFSGPGWSLSKLPDNSLELGTTLPGFVTVQTAPLSWAPTWHLVVVRRAGNRLQIHRDGTMVAERDVGTTAMATSDFPLLVGRRTAVEPSAPNGFALNGSIDELAIWNRALTTTELDVLWSGGAGSPLCDP